MRKPNNTYTSPNETRQLLPKSKLYDPSSVLNDLHRGRFSVKMKRISCVYLDCIEEISYLQVPPHYILLKIANLLNQMLKNSPFQVFLGNNRSQQKKLSNSLPQGPPPLFILYISDMPMIISKKFGYADDYHRSH